MIRSLEIGATGMLAQQMNVDTISNNIANMSTTGFKKQRVEFQDLLYQNITLPGTPSADTGQLVPTGLQLGLGVRAGATYRVHSQGSLSVTDNPLDMAINGNGYFQIQTPDGQTAYTRSGAFSLNENGEIVNMDGFLLDPSITIPDDAIAIEVNNDGEVFAQIRGQPELRSLGQIELSYFINPAGLEAKGGNLFMETQASGTPITGSPNEDNFGSIEQGALEQSNVNSVEEITMLITAQRAYEMNSKVISTSDEMLQSVNQLR